MHKFKVGDLVKLKSEEWFDKNCIKIESFGWQYKNDQHDDHQPIPFYYFENNKTTQYSIVEIEVPIGKSTGYIQLKHPSDRYKHILKKYYLEHAL